VVIIGHAFKYHERTKIKMSTMKKLFKRGDAVTCDDYGIGYIIRINTNSCYPIKVEFQSDNRLVAYTEDGRSDINGDITLRKSNHTWEP
jgi:hypothetical protein